MPIAKRAAAEFIGTFWLVFGGCGAAVLAAAFPGLGIGFLGVALAFGLTLLTMAFAIGHISGCHLNPAVSIGLLVAKRFPAKDLLPYVGSQLLGGITGAGVLFVIASGKAGFDVTRGFACNGYDLHSPGGYSMMACLVAEIVLTFMFLMIILGATDKRVPAGFAPDSHRPRTDADPPHWDSDRQPVGQPRAQHRSGAICRRMGSRTTVAVLVSADCRSGDRRCRLSGDCRRRGTRAGNRQSRSRGGLRRRSRAATAQL